MHKVRWLVIALAIVWFIFGWMNRRTTLAKSTRGLVDYMSSLRSAVSIYYSDTEGIYPSNLQAITVGDKYLHEVPTLGVYTDVNGVHSVKGFPHPPTREILNSSPIDSGKWGYISSAGRVYIDCTHTDTRGSIWSTW